MAQVEVAGFHWQTTLCNITSVTIDSMSSELSSEIHAIIDSLNTHPAPTSNEKDLCFRNERSGVVDNCTQYTADPTAATPQHTFQWQQQPQHSRVPSANTKANLLSPISSGPSNAELFLDSTVSSSNHAAVDPTLPTQPQTIPLHAGHWSVLSNRNLIRNEGQNDSTRCLEVQMPTSKRLWKRQRGHYIKNSTSKASKLLPIKSSNQSRPCYVIQEPVLLHSTSPITKLACHTPNTFAGSMTATELTSPNVDDRASFTPPDRNNASFYTRFLDFPNEMVSAHQHYSMMETAVFGMHTADLSAKKKGQRPKKKRGHQATGDGIYQGMKLWQFLLQVLVENKHPTIVRWTSKQEGTFKVIDSEGLAKLWGSHKNRPEMNYDKMSRAMRYYYNKSLLDKVPRRLYYQFRYCSKWWERLEAFDPSFKMIRIPKPPYSPSRATIDFLSDSERSEPESPTCSDMEHDL